MSRRAKPETERQGAIVSALETMGCMVHRLHCGTVAVPGGHRQGEEAGTPDLIVGLHGGIFFVYMEIKTPTGKLLKKQELMHEKLRKRGSLVFVVRTVFDAKLAVEAALEHGRAAG